MAQSCNLVPVWLEIPVFSLYCRMSHRRQENWELSLPLHRLNKVLLLIFINICKEVACISCRHATAATRQRRCNKSRKRTRMTPKLRQSWYQCHWPLRDLLLLHRDMNKSWAERHYFLVDRENEWKGKLRGYWLTTLVMKEFLTHIAKLLNGQSVGVSK